MIGPLLIACATAPSVPEAWPPPVGARHAYRLRADSRLVAADDGGAPLLTVFVSGTWVFTVVDRDGTDVLVHTELRDPDLQTRSRDPETAELLARVTDELAEPVLATFSTSGALRSVRLAPQISNFAAGVLESALAQVQWVRPPTEVTTWEVTEVQTDGRARIRYTLGPDGTGTRSKVGYVSGVEERPAPEIVRSEATFVRDGAWLASLSVEEVLRTEATAVLGTVEATTALELVSTPPPDGLPAPGWEALAALPARALDTPRASTDTSARDRAAWGGRSLPELREALQAAAVADDEAARARAYSGLVGLLRLRADQVPFVERAVEAGDEDATALITALGDAGTGDAQAALRRLFLEGPPPLRERALIALQRAERPDPATLALYELLLRDGEHVRQALYAAGTAARRLQVHDPREAARLADVLGAWLAGAASPDERVEGLRGLANAGGAAALPHVAPFLTDPVVRVRMAATDALHAIPGDDVDARIAELTHDGAELVRRAAVEAARRRDPSPVLIAALRASSRDEAYLVRMEATRGLAVWVRRDRSLTADLERIAKEEPREEIATVARQALAMVRDDPDR